MYEALQQLDPIRINFSATGMHIINIVLCFVMFGVALGIETSHFKSLIQQPKQALAGFFFTTGGIASHYFFAHRYFQ